MKKPPRRLSRLALALLAASLLASTGAGRATQGAPRHPGAADEGAVGAVRDVSHARGTRQAGPAARIGQSAAPPIYLPLTGIFTRSELVEAAEIPSEGWLHLGPTGNINDLAFDEGRGLLWAATDGGLLRWHPEDDTRLRYSHRPVDLVAVDTEGQVWFGGGDAAGDEALQMIIPGSFPPMPQRDLPAGWIEDIAADPRGGVWVALSGRRLDGGAVEGGGLLHIDAQGQRRHFDLASGLPGRDVVEVAPDGEGGAWLSFGENRFGETAIGPAYLAPDGSLRVEDEATGLDNPRVMMLAVAPDGTLLALAEDFDGWDDTELFERRPDGSWHERSLPRELAERMWPFRYFDTPSFKVEAIAIDGRGRWWLVAPGGLFMREPDGRWEVWPQLGDTLDQETEYALMSAFEGPGPLALGGDGSVWLAGARAGLLGWREDLGWRRHPGDGDLPNDHASSLELDEAGRPWLVGWSAHQLGRDARWQALADSEDAEANGCDSWEQDVVVATAPDGSIWVGDRDAVWQVLPDARRIKHAGGGLAVGRVKVIAFATDGSAWVGGTRGLARQLPSGKWQRFGRADGLPSEDLRAIAFDAAGQIWVGMGAATRWDEALGACMPEGPGGLAHLPAGGSWRALPLAAELDPEEARVNAIAFGPEGDLWVAAGTRLLRRPRSGAWLDLTSTLELDLWDEVTALALDRARNLWVATDGDGVRRIRPDGDWDAFGAGGGKIGDSVRAIHAAADGSVWFGLAYGGLDGARLVRRLPDGTWRAYKEGWDDFSAHEIVALAVDGAGRVWCGTGQDRLLRLNAAARFEALVVHDRLGQAGGQITRLAPTGDGTLWLGSNDGLIRLAPDGTARTWHRADGLPSARITGLAPDAAGAVWAGFGWAGLGPSYPTTDGGIGLLRADGRFEDWSEAAGVVGIQVSELSLGADGQLLASLRAPIGRDGRLVDSRATGIVHRDREGRWRRQDAASGLPSDEVRATGIGPDGRLWLATDRGLASSQEGSAWTLIGLQAGLPSEDVSAIAFAPDGSLWAGTAAGAARLGPDGRWQVHRPRGNPAPVLDLGFDRAGNAWLLLEHGSLRSIAVQLR